MSSQSSLFFQKKYPELIAILNAKREKSVTDFHNLATSKFLLDGSDPLPKLLQLKAQIEAESHIPNSWPLHPSYPLINYHVALVYFHKGLYDQCLSILIDIWNNISLFDELTKLSISLLSIELSLRTSPSKITELSLAQLSSAFPTPQKTSAFLNTKTTEATFISRLVTKVHTAQLRLEIARCIAIGDEPSKASLRARLTEYANIQHLNIYQVLSLSSAALFIGDHKIQSELLTSALPQDEVAIINNKGLNDMVQAHYSQALLSFTKALNTRSTDSIFHPFHQVLYNVGLSLLFKNKPRKAFHIFHSVIPFLQSSPYLWLRLAECCVQYYKRRVQKLRFESQISPTIERQYSSATHTYYVLPIGDSQLFAKKIKESHDGAPPMTLEFAEKCAKKAISLCSPAQVSLRVAAELIGGFIALELGDWSSAISLTAFASSSSVTSQTKLLAKIYRAQGFLMLNETKEGMETLNNIVLEKKLLEANNLTAMFNQTFARSCYQSGDKTKAETFLFQNSKPEQKSPEVCLTASAQEIITGNKEKAINLLKSVPKFGN